VISCPCALVISVPLAFFGGIGAASRAGILVKGSNYLELLAGIGTLAADKTGTLTEGSFEVRSVLPAPGVTEEALLLAAATAENLSTHPIAASILAETGRRGLTGDGHRLPVPEDTEAVPGRGVSVIRKKTLIINLPGSPRAVKESLGFILDTLDHGLRTLRGDTAECGRTEKEQP
jgi:Cd2+/Zn2+-exporting ATPase